MRFKGSHCGPFTINLAFLQSNIPLHAAMVEVYYRENNYPSVLVQIPFVSDMKTALAHKTKDIGQEADLIK